MGAIVSSVAQLPERLKRELIRGEHARAEFAIHEQAALSRALMAQPTKHIEGLGRRVMTIGPELAARLRVKLRGNMDILHDPAFLRALIRDNPMLRNGSVAARTTVRVDGFRGRQNGANSERRIGNTESPASAGRYVAGTRERSETGQTRRVTGEPSQPFSARRSDNGAVVRGHETAGRRTQGSRRDGGTR